MELTLLYIGAAVTFFGMASMVLWPLLGKTSPVEQRVIQAVQGKRDDVRAVGFREKFGGRITDVTAHLRILLGMKANARSAERLYAAGYRDASASDMFFATQLLMPLVGIIAGTFISDNTMFWMFALAATGFMAPTFNHGEKIKKRRERIRRSLPDAIDLMVICVDARLGLDQAVLRVCEELSLSHPEIQEELTRIYLEQRAGLGRMEAWQQMSERVKVPDVTAFVNMLLQTDRYGTPISRALNNFSAELRTKRRQHAEEAAAKTKIKIIFPLVFCIFPCLFIVLLAPAMLAITRGLAVSAK